MTLPNLLGPQKTNPETCEWGTPDHILGALGPFDDDPAVPGEQDGLSREWRGFVFLNPPYGRGIGAWMRKMSEYGNGIALTFARTDTRWFHEYVWTRAAAILFLKGRLSFKRDHQESAAHNAGAPSVLIGYGDLAVDRLRKSGLPGRLVLL